MVFVLDRLLRFGLKWSEKSLLAYLQGQIPNIKTTINPLFIHVLELTEWRSSFRIRTGILKFKNLKTLIPKAKKLNKKSDTVRIYAEFHCFRAIIKICCTLPEIVLIHSHKRVKKKHTIVHSFLLLFRAAPSVPELVLQYYFLDFLSV